MLRLQCQAVWEEESKWGEEAEERKQMQMWWCCTWKKQTDSRRSGTFSVDRKEEAGKQSPCGDSWRFQLNKLHSCVLHMETKGHPQQLGLWAVIIRRAQRQELVFHLDSCRFLTFLIRRFNLVTSGLLVSYTSFSMFSVSFTTSHLLPLLQILLPISCFYYISPYLSCPPI